MAGPTLNDYLPLCHADSSDGLAKNIYYLCSDTDSSGCIESKVSIHRMPNPNKPHKAAWKRVQCWPRLAEIVHRMAFIYGYW